MGGRHGVTTGMTVTPDTRFLHEGKLPVLALVVLQVGFSRLRGGTESGSATHLCTLARRPLK